MAKTIQIERLVRIVSLLTANKKGLSAQKISEKLKEEGINFSDRTIRRDFDDIESAFGIEIVFNAKEKVWTIDPETLSDQQLLLDHLLLMEAYRRAKDQHILLVEPQPERGLEMLEGFLLGRDHRKTGVGLCCKGIPRTLVPYRYGRQTAFQAQGICL